MSLSTSKNLYGDHFGLSEFPFGITPNPEFSYNNSLYREAFATLRYGIEARKGFIVITGEVGTGKTTLLRAFMRSVESTVHTAFIFNPKLNFNQLIGSVLADLGAACSSRDRFTLIEKLNDYLIEQFKKDHIVAVLVDEAQALSDEMLEELRLLSNLETDRSRLIQIVLTGQPEFERRLDQPELRQLKQRIALRCRLTPLPSDEVGAYIDHRLRKAGYQGNELFETKAVERISLNSQGIPRLINVICDNALLIAYASSKKKVSAEMIEEATHDLELTVASRNPRSVSVLEDFQGLRRRDEVPRAEMQGDEPRVNREFDRIFIEEQAPKLYQRHKAKKVGLKIFLSLVLMIGLGAVFHSQPNRVEVFSEQSGNYISGIAVKVEQQGRQSLSSAARKAEDYFDLSRNYFSDLTARMKSDSPQGTNYLSDLSAAMSVQFEKTTDSVSAITAKMEDYLHERRNYVLRMAAKMKGSFQKGWDYLSALAVLARNSIATQRENLRRVDVIPEASQDNRANIGLADSPDRQANEKPPLKTEQPSQPELGKDAATVREAKKIAEPQTPKTPTTAADERETTNAIRDQLEGQPIDSRMDPSEAGPLQRDRQITSKREPSFLGDFEVFQDSFLRDKPRSDATITTLPPGARVRVESKAGDYLRVRSLNDPELRGYVHREDAFFERIR